MVVSFFLRLKVKKSILESLSMTEATSSHILYLFRFVVILLLGFTVNVTIYIPYSRCELLRGGAQQIETDWDRPILPVP